MKTDSVVILGMIGAWAEQHERQFGEAAKVCGQAGECLNLSELLVLAEGFRRLQEGIRLVIEDEGGDLTEVEPFLQSDSVADEHAPMDHLASFLDFKPLRERGVIAER